jgi:hypothetical protein
MLQCDELRAGIEAASEFISSGAEATIGNPTHAIERKMP